MSDLDKHNKWHKTMKAMSIMMKSEETFIYQLHWKWTASVT